MSEKLQKKIDIAVLILFPILAVSLSLLLKANLVTSTLLFFGLPSIYFSFRTPKMVPKTFIFALILTVFIGPWADYIATVSGAWFVPNSAFPIKLFGVVTFDNLQWLFFFVYSVLIFYEHFCDKGKKELVDRRMKYLVWPLFAVLFIFILFVRQSPALLNIPYAYVWLGLITTLLPGMLFLNFFPNFLSRYVKVSAYFFILSILFELTALELGQWSFPGTTFIGWVDILGYRFPFEEFFFWFLLAVTAILSIYEYFDDDRK